MGITRQFLVFKHVEDGDEDVAWAYEAVKIGFAWPALVFGPLWALAKGFWGIAAILALALFLSRFLDTWSYTQFTRSAFSTAMWGSIVYVVLLFFVAFRGNSWRAQKIAKEDYDLVREVRAKSAKEAIELVRAEDSKGGDFDH